MDCEWLTFVQSELQVSLETLSRASRSEQFHSEIGAISSCFLECLRTGGKIMFAGNGGSAADAQHIAGEFLSRLNYDRAPLAGIALTTDTSVLTAVGNDYGYDAIFERQVAGLGRAGDVLVAISTSGRSRNVIKALKAARQMGIKTVGFAGMSGGPMAQDCDLLLHAPSDRTPLIQQLHITAAHIMCGLVEKAMFPR